MDLNAQVAHPTTVKGVVRIYDGHSDFAPGFYFVDEAEQLNGVYATVELAAQALKAYVPTLKDPVTALLEWARAYEYYADCYVGPNAVFHTPPSQESLCQIIQRGTRLVGPAIRHLEERVNEAAHLRKLAVAVARLREMYALGNNPCVGPSQLVAGKEVRDQWVEVIALLHESANFVREKNTAELHQALKESNDLLLDAWGQFSIDMGDGWQGDGALSTLERIAAVLVARGLLIKHPDKDWYKQP